MLKELCFFFTKRAAWKISHPETIACIDNEIWDFVLEDPLILQSRVEVCKT